MDVGRGLEELELLRDGRRNVGLRRRSPRGGRLSGRERRAAWHQRLDRRGIGDLDPGVRRRHEVGVADEKGGQLRPLLGLLPAGSQGAPQPRVGRVELQASLQRGLRPFGVTELLAGLRQLERPGDAVDVAREVHELREGRRRPLPLASLLADARDRLEGAAVASVALEDLLVRRHGRRDVAETPFLDLAQPHEQRQLPRLIAAVPRAVELPLEQLGQLVVPPGLLVELRQGEHRLGVPGLLVEDRAQRLDPRRPAP